MGFFSKLFKPKVSNTNVTSNSELQSPPYELPPQILTGVNSDTIVFWGILSEEGKEEIKKELFNWTVYSCKYLCTILKNNLDGGCIGLDNSKMTKEDIEAAIKLSFTFGIFLYNEELIKTADMLTPYFTATFADKISPPEHLTLEESIKYIESESLKRVESSSLWYTDWKDTFISNLQRAMQDKVKK